MTIPDHHHIILTVPGGATCGICSWYQVQDLESQLAKVSESRELLANANEGYTDLLADVYRQHVTLQAEAKLNASMLARQIDLARKAEARAQEQAVALSALAERGPDIAASAEHQDTCPKGKAIRHRSKKLNLVVPDPVIEATPCECGLTEAIAHFNEALALGSVQKAVEAQRVKDEEIIRLRQIVSQADEFIPSLKTKLATAMALLTKVHGLDCRFCGQLIRLGHEPDCEYAAFLADPSQAAVQYRKALAVVERVENVDWLMATLEEARSREDGWNESLYDMAWKLQKALLGNVPQGGGAFAPEAVQKTLEAWKAKDAEIEHLQQLLRDAQFATIDTASDAETRLVSRLQESEAKLATAMGLLRSCADCYCCPDSFAARDFLASPSQTAPDTLTGGVADVEAEALARRALDGTHYRGPEHWD